MKVHGAEIANPSAITKIDLKLHVFGEIAKCGHFHPVRPPEISKWLKLSLLTQINSKCREMRLENN